MLTNIIAVAVIVLIVGGAGVYIIRAKKKGQRCIGCPAAKNCQGSCGCCPSANTCNNNDKGSTNS